MAEHKFTETFTEVRFKGVSIRIYLKNKDLTNTSGYGPSIDEIDYVKEVSAEIGENVGRVLESQ